MIQKSKIKIIINIENLIFDNWEKLDKNIKKSFWKITSLQLLASLLEIVALAYLTLYIAWIIKNETALEKIKYIEKIANINIEVYKFTWFLILIYILKTILVYKSIRGENKFVGKYSAIVGCKLLMEITSNEKYTYGDMDISEKQRIIEIDAMRTILYIKNYSNVIKEIISIILIVGMAAVYDFKVLVLIASIFSLLYLIYDKIILTILIKDGKLNKSVRIRELQALSKIIELNKLIKIYGIESKEYEKYKRTIIEREEIEGRRRLIGNLPKISLELITISIIALTVMINTIYETNGIEGMLLGIIGLSIMAIRLIPTLNTMSYAISEIAYQSDSFQRVKKILSDDLIKPEIFNENKNQKEIIEYNKLSEIVINNIWYKYPNSTKQIFKGLNVKIKPGDIVGVFGSSGVGKTTLIELLMGAIKPEQGNITYNGISIHDNKKEWCRVISLVQQETKFFPGTIYENIVFDDSNINLKRFNKACEIARITEVVKILEKLKPKEIPASISHTLSGGQRQRLALARALYKDTKVIILDEATSALDDETKNEIMKDLIKLKGSVTVIMVTHDLNLKKYFDAFINLDK